MNGFLIGKVIYKILTDDTSVYSYVSNKVFPMVASIGTSYPFVTYTRQAVLAEDTKDKFICSEIANVQIAVVSDDYETSLEIANVIQSALNGRQGTYNGIEITDIIYQSIEETFVDDAYAQIINYKIYLK